MSPDPAIEDWSATETLFPAVYEELKRLAHGHLRGIGGGSLCTTELVHESFLKLARGQRIPWEGRAHFFGAASRAMRQILVDFARHHQAAKRGGDWRAVSLSDVSAVIEFELAELLDIDAALDRLDAVNPRLRRLVELRFFAGLGEKETAELLGVTVRTVERDWLKARLFLLRELDPGEKTERAAGD